MVPRCLCRLLSSPVEAVIRYCQPSGHSHHIQVEHSQDIAFPYPAGWKRTGELQKPQTVLKVCVTLMSNLSTGVCYKKLLKKCKLYGRNHCANLYRKPHTLHDRKIYPNYTNTHSQNL